jgi:hypothetical protein
LELLARHAAVLFVNLIDCVSSGAEKFPTADAKVNLFPALSDIRDAIAREKQLKKWSRSKKIVLINRLNPNWLDLGSDVLQDI